MGEKNEKVENDMHQPVLSKEAIEDGLRFKRAREKKHFSRAEVTELTSGISASYIFKIEEGRISPSFSVLKNLADVYGVSMKTLLGMAEEEGGYKESNDLKSVNNPYSTRNYTYQEYLEWSGRWELIKGIPYKMTSPDMLHQRLTARICVAIGSYIGAHLGNNKQEVFAAPYEVRFSTKGNVKEIDTVVQPDLSVVFYERFEGKSPRPPQLVVEVLSVETALIDRTLKFELYRESGVQEYWIADPNKKTIVIYNFQGEGTEEEKFVKEDILQSSYLLDFKFPIRNFFD